MKTSLSLLLAFITVPVFAQGPLSPPSAATPQNGPTASIGPDGNPQSAMKTLYQVEPRIAVQTLAAAPPYVITQPGSYYLTDNITVASDDAITIRASGVTLDLNGFSINSTSAAASGIAIGITGNISRITVKHGSISGTTTVSAAGAVSGGGFRHGIYTGGTITQTLISDIHVSGVGSGGIIMSDLATIERCSVTNCGEFGMVADQVNECSAVLCHDTAIRAFISATNCRAESTSSFGINSGGSVLNCRAQTSGTTTFAIAAQANVENCTGIATATDMSSPSLGIRAAGNANNSHGISATGTALYVVGNVENCQGETTASGPAAYGIYTESNVMNSTGVAVSSAGIQATGNVMNSVGKTSGATASAFGIRCQGTATGSFAATLGGGASFSLQAAIAIGCTTVGPTSIPAGKSFNM